MKFLNKLLKNKYAVIVVVSAGTFAVLRYGARSGVAARVPFIGPIVAKPLSFFA